MTPADYSFDLGVGEVSADGATNNTFALLPMSVPKNCTAEEKQAMFFWLNQGLVWLYAFNHEEGIKCFQRALDVSSLCIFGHWGIALCHGPNYNTKAMSRDSFPSAKEAFKHAQMVSVLLNDPTVVSGLSAVEVAVLSALSCRFNPVSDTTPADALIEANTTQYTTALREVYTQYPSFACVACLFAETLMNASPWKLWDLETGAPEPHAQQAKEVLERAIRRFPHHPGLNHFVVHLMEMSPTPQAALPSCDVLRFHFPDAGHLIHMPSHIYVLLGMYDQAAACNLEAIAADEKYVLKEGIYNCYTGYRIHNIHFVSYAAMFAGQYEVAMEAALQIRKNLPDDLLSNPFMAKYFEAFLSIEWHVLVRFGQWTEILSRPVPAPEQEGFLFPYTLAMQHYARGIAHAVLAGQEGQEQSGANDKDNDDNDNDKVKDKSTLLAAEKELSLLQTTALLVPADRVMHNNTCHDLLAVGEAMLRGEIQYRGGDFSSAFSHLRDAIRLSDALVYDEPWGWMQPPRHALGALLLEQRGGGEGEGGRGGDSNVQQAEQQFRKDMDPAFIGRCHPDNLWALSGLARCLQLHPEEYESRGEEAAVTAAVETSENVNEDNDEDITSAATATATAHTTTSGQQSSSSASPSSSVLIPAKQNKNKRKLELDWTHLDPASDVPVTGGGSSGQSHGLSVQASSSRSRKQELAVILQKLSAIKAVARSKAVKGKKKGEEQGEGEEWPWLAENVTVAACLCAKSTIGVPSCEEEGGEANACNKRKKMS